MWRLALQITKCYYLVLASLYQMVSVKTELLTCLPGCHFTSINTAQVLIFASHDYQTSKQANPFRKEVLQESWRRTELPTLHRISMDTGNFHDLQILPEHLRIKEPTLLLKKKKLKKNNCSQGKKRKTVSLLCVVLTNIHYVHIPDERDKDLCSKYAEIK